VVINSEHESSEVALALFGRSKGEVEDASADAADGVPQPAPERAVRFFEHAQTSHEATNYEYAMQLWLSGLRQDPGSLRGVEGFFKSAGAFLGASGGKRSKDTEKSLSGRGPVEKYLAGLFEWGSKPTDGSLAAKATEAASQIKQPEVAHWLGERALSIARADKKAKKDAFVRLLDALEAVGDFKLAALAGEDAVRLDPADQQLSTRVRNLAAKDTMSSGGYDATGQQGGFRANVRDMSKQRSLEEGERISKSEDVKDRLVAEAEAAHAQRPDDLPTINQLAKRLIERGRPEDEDRAVQLYAKAFKDTGQFRFREQEGEVRLRKARRALASYRAKAEQNPQDTAAQDLLRRAQNQFWQREAEELQLRVSNYPTNLELKYELAKRLAMLEQFDRAIPLLQEAQLDAKHRLGVLFLLGQCFERIGWTDEAIQTYRGAMDAVEDPSSTQGLEIRYGLMSALQSKAGAERDLESAVEAEKIASGIAIVQITFKDIRERREALKKLIAELRAG
jgi:Flp pilus assembly protein TadD